MIRGRRIYLVAVSMEFLDHYRKWINDPHVTDMLGQIRFPMSELKEREWVQAQIDGDGSQRNFTILTKKGVPIGNIGFSRLNWHSRVGVLGIMIGEKSLWDKGYGAEAINLLLEFGFRTLGLHRVVLYVDSVNERAIACYKKCGFVVEGAQRKHEFYRGGYIEDLFMGILREDWEKRKP
jgi:RimJ/RimL family protein N-acetyltransferase